LGQDEWKKKRHEGFAVAGMGISNDFSEQDKSGQNQQSERDSAMELAEFRINPTIQPPFQKTPFIRVRAVEFERTGIARARGCAVRGDPMLVIGVQLHELMASGALPIVELMKVGESRVPVAIRPFLRTPGQTLQDESYTHKEQPVREGKKHF
jgi:hypothetical protein